MPDIQLIIRTIAEGTGDKDLQKGLKDLNGAIGVVRSSYEILNQTWNETIGKTVKYANDVRGLSLVIGQNAEKTSRVIQVADDYKLSVDQLTLAHRNLAKNGMSLSIDTLAALSDKYVRLNEGQERTSFLMENFGARGGLAFAEIMSKGGDAILEQARAIEAGLIMDEKKLRAARNLELAQDSLNDRMQALSLTIGTNAVPAATAWVETLDKIISGQVDWGKEIQATNGLALVPMIGLMKVYGDTANQITADLDAAATSTENLTGANEALIPSLEEIAAAQQEISDINTAMVGTITSIQQAEESYTEKSVGLAESRKKAEEDLALLRAQGYWEQGTQIQGVIGKLDDIKQAEANLEKERARQTLQFISDLLLQRLSLDGLTTAEFEAFAKQQEAWGLWSAGVVEKAKAAWTEAEKISAAINAIPTSKTVTVTVNTTSNGGYTPAPVATPMDSGGEGEAGKAYFIGRGAQPEMFVPSTNGRFIPNADRLLRGGGSNGSAATQSPTFDFSAISDQLAATAAMMQALPDAIARAVRGNEKYAR